MSDPLARAWILLEQAKYDLAEREIRSQLANHPSRADAHALLALCLSEREEFQQATEEAQTAVHLDPESSLGHYVLASVMLDRNRIREAEAAIRQAIRLAPESAANYAVLARIHLGQKQWQQALAAAEQGLAVDAEHVDCSNARSVALAYLGRDELAIEYSQESLRQNPDNALSHAIHASNLLNKGDYQQAQVHYREALRLEPDNDFARTGMIRALNARSPVFRLMLRYYTAMSRLQGRTQWMIILGLYFGARILRSIAREVPALQPLVIPILVLYGIFVLLTWMNTPLFNTMLRFNRFGRYLLDRGQVLESNLIVGLIGVGLIGLVGFGLAGEWGIGILTLLMCCLMLLPIRGVFQCSPGWPRRTMTFYAGVLAVFACAALWSFAMPAKDQSNPYFVAFLLGVFAGQFISNGLAFVEPKK